MNIKMTEMGAQSMRHNRYRERLMGELIPALGCTEPIALALAAAKARETIALPLARIDRIDVFCSGNIVKNAKAVIVPNSGGARGMEIAVALGIAGGASAMGLKVLAQVTPDQLAEATALRAAGKIGIHVVYGEEDLYIRVELQGGPDQASVEIRRDHTRINRVIRNGVVIEDRSDGLDRQEDAPDEELSLDGILTYAEGFDPAGDPELVSAIRAQIELNYAIAREGLCEDYGAAVGRTIQEMGDPKTLPTRIKALTAAASDARMGGSSFPVVINSGSGNQGLTASVPVIEAAAWMGVPEDQLIRALIISNLLAVHQKRFIGKLSAFCGAVSAAAGAGAGIAYLEGRTRDELVMVVTNTLATIGGMVRDGAKSSCALKIAESLDTMLTGLEMARHGRVFQPGEGLVGADVEETIRNVGRMAKLGMKETDEEILKIMTQTGTPGC